MKMALATLIQVVFCERERVRDELKLGFRFCLARGLGFWGLGDDPTFATVTIALGLVLSTLGLG